MMPFSTSKCVISGDRTQHGIFAVFQQTVQPPQHEHRQNDIAVFASHVDITQAVISDRPDKRDEFVVYGVIP